MKISELLWKFSFPWYNEMADITFSRFLLILMNAVMASIQKTLKWRKGQLAAIIADFEIRLPKYLLDDLQLQFVAALNTVLLAEILNYQRIRSILGMGSLR